MAAKTKKKAKKKAPASKPKKKSSVKKSTAKKSKSVKKKTSAKKKKAAPKKKATAKKKATKKKVVKKTPKAKKKPAPKKKAPAKKKSPAKKSAKKTSTSKKKASRKSESSNKKRLVVQKHDPSKLDPIISKIRTHLISERNELLKMIQSSQEVERNVGDLTFSNEIDLASSLEGREMAFQLSSRERNELKMIEEALFRIKTGTYGVCEGCSRNIGTKRLQIMPLTPLCIECQESLEVG